MLVAKTATNLSGQHESPPSRVTVAVIQCMLLVPYGRAWRNRGLVRYRRRPKKLGVLRSDVVPTVYLVWENDHGEARENRVSG